MSMKKRFMLVAALLLAGQYTTLHAQQPILVKDINTGSGAATPKYFTQYNNKLYFQAFDSTNGTELWATDGTEAGTALVKDINPGPGSSNPQEFKVFNGKLYFQADNGVDTVRAELWVSDGTAAGTYMLKRINTNNFFTLGSLPAEFTECNGKLYFRARDNGGGGTGDELWVTDGRKPAHTWSKIYGRDQNRVILRGLRSITTSFILRQHPAHPIQSCM